MFNRNDLIAEQLLRENIRRAINIVQVKKKKEEDTIRTIVRSLVSEGTTIIFTRKHCFSSRNMNILL